MDLGMPYLLENETIENCTDLCRNLGLQFVELNMNFPECQLDVLKADELNRIKEEKGIYFTIHLDENLNICDFNREIREGYKRTVLGAIKLAGEIEAPIINMHLARGIHITLPDRKVNLFEKYSDVYMQSILEFRRLCEDAVQWECHGAMGKQVPQIAIENTNGFLPYEYQAIEAMLESDCFGLTLDIGHSHAVGDMDIPFYRKHTDKLIHMHAHDAKGSSNHLAFGDGEIDLSERLLWAANEGARVVLETKTVEALTKSVGITKERMKQLIR